MGLDISAYRQLKKTETADVCRDDDGNIVEVSEHDRHWYAHPVSIRWAEEHFPGRSEGIEPGVVYEFSERFSFRAGSYGGYNNWRDKLARHSGYPSQQSVVENHLSGPFVELINFADNEGVIGPVVSAKLAKDFQEQRKQIMSNVPGHDHYFVDLYDKWQRAFEMAADGGAVEFH